MCIRDRKETGRFREHPGVIHCYSYSPEIHLSKEVIQESIEELGVPVTIRGEALTLEQFAALSNIIGRRMKQQV